MGKFKIIESDTGLEIEVSAKAGEKDLLLGEFQKCQQGQCTCPTEEYKKLEAMAVELDDGFIRIQLTPKEFQAFDKFEIARCLEHTTRKHE